MLKGLHFFTILSSLLYWYFKFYFLPLRLFLTLSISLPLASSHMASNDIDADIENVFDMFAARAALAVCL